MLETKKTRNEDLAEAKDKALEKEQECTLKESYEISLEEVLIEAVEEASVFTQ